MVEPYEKELVAREEDRLRIEKARNEADVRRTFDEQLGGLRDRYLALVQASDTAKRGYELEALLRDVFELFDLDPRASFRIEGEQLDGAFSLDGTNFLLEAKWQAVASERSDLDSFAAKISAKIENTLGLFISINGFEPTAVTKHSGKGSVMILMDGADLYAVLDARIDLVDLLRRKHRHAAHSGEILLTAAAILGT